MPEVDKFARSYVVVDVHEAATGASIATLLEGAAATLRAAGEINVQHIALDASDDAHSPVTALTIYYDRVERRRQHRGNTEGGQRT